MGQRLIRALRESDSLCSQDSDEFVLYLPDAMTPDQLVAIRRKLAKLQ